VARKVRLLALLGSPRKAGNTEVLMHAALRGAEEAGASVQSFWLRALAVSPCIECRRCDATGACVLKDRMNDIYAALEDADRLILSSPVFFYGVSGWTKAVLDRFQPFWARKRLLKRPAGEGRERYGAFISAAATGGRRLFEGSILTVRYCFEEAGFYYAGHILVRGVDNTGDMARHPEHLAAAEEMGRALVLEPSSVRKYEG